MPAPKTRARAMSWLPGRTEDQRKKDDDLTAPRPAWSGNQWQTARAPRRRPIMRLLVYAVVLIVLFMGLSSIISLRNANAALQARPIGAVTPVDAPASENDEAKHIPQVEQKKTYKGPVKLPALGETLQAIGGTQGKQAKNRNVLFAAASLRSAATLLPLACRMAMEKQSYVHFALMGRSDVPIKELKKLNGIDEDCQMILHDARPDHSGASTDARMMMCSARAMHYINNYMHPQAIFVDSTVEEEPYFLSGIRDQVRSVRGALIELPSQPGTRLSWLTKLDSASLNAWDKIHIDIIIHAPKHGVGNLQRLLKSLSEVDMSGMSTPHLTIELPQTIPPQLQQQLANFQWPPRTSLSGHRPHMLALRHRIPRAKMTEEESSIRFLESFWPRNPEASNVLILSPHTEVTPQFLHYVKYALLHYRYSNAAMIQRWDIKTMGLGFASPSKLLDGSSPFQAPSPETEKAGAAYLWQAPSSDAMLIPGKKWVELHAYVSRVLERQQLLSETPAILSQKEVSKQHPAWLEYLLQLCRLRGYYTVYPGIETSSVILGVHNDIPQIPEEYEDDEDARKRALEGGKEDEATWLFDPHWAVDMLETLPGGGNLPWLSALPIANWEGKQIADEDLNKESRLFAAQFRRTVGLCTEDDDPGLSNQMATDLFCKASD